MSENPSTSARRRAVCPAALIVLLLCAGTHGAAPTTDFGDLKRQVDAARQKVKELEAKAFAKRPDLKEAVDQREALRASGDAADDVKGRTERYLQDHLKAAKDKVKQDYDALVSYWSTMREIELTDTIGDTRLRILLATPEWVKNIKGRLQHGQVQLPQDKEDDPRTIWEVFRTAMQAGKPRLMRRIEMRERTSGLPEYVAVHARRMGAREFDAAFLGGYIAMRTPADLRAARDELHQLELQLPAEPDSGEPSDDAPRR